MLYGFVRTESIYNFLSDPLHKYIIKDLKNLYLFFPTQSLFLMVYIEGRQSEDQQADLMKRI